MPLGALVYRADVGGGLIEHEYVHLFAGRWRGDVLPDPDEAEAHAWRDLGAIQADATARPQLYTVWFRLYLLRADAGLAEAMQPGIDRRQ
jgi:isopentenyl-diphosphate delta-isomerase